MIARLTGRLAQKSPDALIVDVHGVGYRVLVSLTAFAALPAEGAEVTIAIHTHVRETAIELFGFADTADATLPPLKRYFDGAGTQLVEGAWSRVVVDIDVDTEYHLVARRADDEVPTFHLFGPDAQTGCKVAPNAGTWLMGKADDAPYRLLPFAESLDERGRGPVRFTTMTDWTGDFAPRRSMASSTLIFSGMGLPPRTPSSAVTMQVEPQSSMRPARLSGEKPPKTTE